MTTLAVSLLFVVTVLLVVLVLVTVLFLRTLQKMADANDRTHERFDKLVRNFSDRFMATDFATFKAYESVENAPAGGQVLPDDEEDLIPQTVPDGVHTLRELLYTAGGDDAA